MFCSVFNIFNSPLWSMHSPVLPSVLNPAEAHVCVICPACAGIWICSFGALFLFSSSWPHLLSWKETSLRMNSRVKSNTSGPIAQKQTSCAQRGTDDEIARGEVGWVVQELKVTLGETKEQRNKVTPKWKLLRGAGAWALGPQAKRASRWMSGAPASHLDEATAWLIRT